MHAAALAAPLPALPACPRACVRASVYVCVLRAPLCMHAQADTRLPLAARILRPYALRNITTAFTPAYMEWQVRAPQQELPCMRPSCREHSAAHACC